MSRQTNEALSGQITHGELSRFLQNFSFSTKFLKKMHLLGKVVNLSEISSSSYCIITQLVDNIILKKVRIQSQVTTPYERCYINVCGHSTAIELGLERFKN